MELRRPDFFIIGNPRSGTTLLRLLLSSHSKIIVPPESIFVIKLERICNSNLPPHQIVDEIFQIQKFENLGLSKSGITNKIKVRDTYYNLVNIILDEYIKKIKPSASLVGDKNNPYITQIIRLHNLFPKAKFIHIIRDGRDVALSYIKNRRHKGEHRPVFPSSLGKIASSWKKNIVGIQDQFKKIPQEKSIEIRFEDLVVDTEGTLISVCNFLNVAYEDQMLKYFMNEQLYEEKEYDQWKWKNKSPIISHEANKWRHEMFDENISLFQFMCRSVLTRYNYPIVRIKPSYIAVYGYFYALNYSLNEIFKRIYKKILNSGSRA